MKDPDDIIIQPKDEKDDYYSNDDMYNISSWGADLSFRELIQMYDDDELVKPELQRYYVWDKSEASRFIDSILLGLPVPSIFLAKTKDEKMLIVDGYQRLMTVHDYVHGIWSKDNKIFRLTQSNKVNKRWHGKAFSELSDIEQRRIKNTTIHSIIFVQDKPKNDNTSMYQIFERINTSGRTLFPQEIRNCIYQGLFNTLLINLNENQDWRFLFGLKEPDPRMRDMEFILRFMALNSKMFKEISSKTISLKKFLNDFMDSEDSKIKECLSSMKEEFIRVIEAVKANFGHTAFQNLSKRHPNSYVSKINPTIYDSIMLATAKYLKEPGRTLPNNLKKRKLNLLKQEDYQDLIRVRTTEVKRINDRISMAYDILYREEDE